MTDPSEVATAEVVRRLAADAGLDATGEPDTVPASDLEYRFDPTHTCELLADALVALHGVTLEPALVEGAPAAVDDVLVRAERNVATGAVRVDPAYGHIEPARLLAILAEGADQVRSAPGSDVVPTHGRPDLDALRCRDGTFVGFESWGAAAPADRHRDLAAALTAVASSLGPMLVPSFVARYDLRPDPRRLDWWALAHQLAPVGPVRPQRSDAL